MRGLSIPLAGICNMTQRINLNDSARREILIATRNNDFMGLVLCHMRTGDAEV